MCVRVLATTETHCSDGVRLDTDPPTPGAVRFRHTVAAADTQADDMQSAGPQAHVQAAANYLTFEWDAFGDAEREAPPPGSGHPPATSAVRGYEYAVGTAPGRTDTVPWTDAGLATSAVATGLRLARGVVYFASVRATDQAGLTSTATTRPGVMVDDTPPTGGQVTDIIVSPTKAGLVVAARWTPVTDEESGLATVEWAVGTQPYVTDLAAFAPVGDAGDEGATRVVPGLVSGQRFFVTVRAINHAGLHSTTTSPEAIAEYTPPVPAAVFDGAVGSGDVDYQASTTRAAVHWLPFAEPHTAITGYAWCLGTVAGDCDVKGYESAGVGHEAAADLALDVGVRYFASVRGCNSAGLCAVGSSDGFMVDDTPPVLGLVMDGLRGEDVAFVGTDSVLAAHWAGFHDPQTGVLAYAWCAGTAAGECDIVDWQDAYQREEAVLLLPASGHLKPKADVYVTVRATNWAGLAATASSNGFVVDITPPLFEAAPVISSGSRRLSFRDVRGLTQVLTMPAGTQVDPSLLAGSWQAADGESGVVSTSWSLQTHLGGDPTVQPVFTGGMESITAAGLALASGDRYELLVSACNAARLCTTARSKPVLVDYTPPYGGVLERFHTVVAGGTSTRPVVQFAFGGFLDPDSDVAEYRLEVRTGSLFGRTAASGAIVYQTTVGHNGAQGARQLVTAGPLILTKPLDLAWQGGLYVAVYPVNGVGAQGAPLTARLRADARFVERLIDCQAEDCSGACACSPVNAPCDIGRAVPRQAPCAVRTTGVPATATATAFIGTSAAQAAATPPPTASTAVLTGGWVSAAYAETPTRYEVTAGLVAEPAQPPGAGLFNLAEDVIWQDPGTTPAIHELVFPRGDLRMLAGQRYQLYVRAYVDRNGHRTVASKPVLCDPTPPTVSQLKRVVDATVAKAAVDEDYADATTTLYAGWAGVFADAQSGISHFTVGLGTAPGAADVVALRKVGLGACPLYCGHLPWWRRPPAHLQLPIERPFPPSGYCPFQLPATILVFMLLLCPTKIDCTLMEPCDLPCTGSPGSLTL